jgi:hypothetical protein
MKELFATYSQAKELKELGMDIPCLRFYQNSENLSDVLTDLDIPHFTNKKSGTYACIAPLKQQVFFFFRSKYNIESEIRIMAGSNIHGLRVKGKEKIYQYWIHNLNDKHWSSGETVSNEFETYEQAESECIDKLISLLKEKQ